MGFQSPAEEEGRVGERQEEKAAPWAAASRSTSGKGQKPLPLKLLPGTQALGAVLLGWLGPRLPERRGAGGAGV